MASVYQGKCPSNNYPRRRVAHSRNSMEIDYLINPITAFLVAVADFALLALVVLYFTRRETLIRALGPYSLHTLFILALVGSAGSLFYSNVLGYAPCSLCWWQRIFCYSQVVILGVALWKHDANVWLYSLWLSSIGIVVALYQYLLQWGLAPSIGCGTSPGAVDCSARIMLGLGYVTIPMMALTGFGLLIILALVMREYQQLYVAPSHS